MKCCPTCGRPYPPTLEISGTVRRRLVEILLKFPHGLEMSDLIELVYANAPDGAPASAPNCINVLAHMANKQLKPQGWRIIGTKGRGSRYILVNIKDVELRKETARSAAPRSDTLRHSAEKRTA